MDIALLRATCECTQGVHIDEPHVQFLFEVLEHDLGAAERVAWLRFVSGRTRLPPPAMMGEKYKHLTIKPLSKAENAPGGAASQDGFLPESHTCFFYLDLPRYSSRHVMLERMRYAIATCRSIDNDATPASEGGAFPAMQDDVHPELLRQWAAAGSGLGGGGGVVIASGGGGGIGIGGGGGGIGGGGGPQSPGSGEGLDGRGFLV